MSSKDFQVRITRLDSRCLFTPANTGSKSSRPGMYSESAWDGLLLTAAAFLPGVLATARLLVAAGNNVSFEEDHRARVGTIAKMWACPTTGFSPLVTRAQDQCQFIAEQNRTEQETRPGDAGINFPLLYEEREDFSSGRYLHVHVKVLSTSSSGGQGCSLRLSQHDAIIFVNSSNLEPPSTCPPDMTYSQLELVKPADTGSNRGLVQVKLPPKPYATAPLKMTRVLLYKFFDTEAQGPFPIAPGCDPCKGVHVLQPAPQEEQYELAYLQLTNSPLCHVPSGPFVNVIVEAVYGFKEAFYLQMDLPSQLAFAWLGLALVSPVVFGLHCSLMFASEFITGVFGSKVIAEARVFPKAVGSICATLLLLPCIVCAVFANLLGFILNLPWLAWGVVTSSAEHELKAWMARLGNPAVFGDGFASASNDQPSTQGATLPVSAASSLRQHEKFTICKWVMCIMLALNVILWVEAPTDLALKLPAHPVLITSALLLFMLPATESGCLRTAALVAATGVSMLSDWGGYQAHMFFLLRLLYLINAPGSLWALLCILLWSFDLERLGMFMFVWWWVQRVTDRSGSRHPWSFLPLPQVVLVKVQTVADHAAASIASPMGATAKWFLAHGTIIEPQARSRGWQTDVLVWTLVLVLIGLLSIHQWVCLLSVRLAWEFPVVVLLYSMRSVRDLVVAIFSSQLFCVLLVVMHIPLAAQGTFPALLIASYSASYLGYPLMMLLGACNRVCQFADLSLKLMSEQDSTGLQQQQQQQVAATGSRTPAAAVPAKATLPTAAAITAAAAAAASAAAAGSPGLYNDIRLVFKGMADFVFTSLPALLCTAWAAELGGDRNAYFSTNPLPAHNHKPQLKRTALPDGSDLPPGYWMKYELPATWRRDPFVPELRYHVPASYVWVEVAPEVVEAIQNRQKRANAPRGGRRKAARENALRDLLNFTSAGPSCDSVYQPDQGEPSPPAAAAAAALALAVAASEALQEGKPKGQKLKQQSKQRDRGNTQQGQGRSVGQEQGQQQQQQQQSLCQKQGLSPGGMKASSSSSVPVRTSFAAAAAAAAGNRGGSGPSLPSASATAAAAAIGVAASQRSASEAAVPAAAQHSGEEPLAAPPGGGARPSSRDHGLPTGSSQGSSSSSSNSSRATATTRTNGSGSSSTIAMTSSSLPLASTPQPQHFWDFLDRLTAEVQQNQPQRQQEAMSGLSGSSVTSSAAAAARPAGGFVSSRFVASSATAPASAGPSTCSSSGSGKKDTNGCTLIRGRLGVPCLVCQSGRSCVLLRPCFHLVLCRECSSILKQQGGACPQCKQTVEAHMPVIKS